MTSWFSVVNSCGVLWCKLQDRLTYFCNKSLTYSEATTGRFLLERWVFLPGLHMVEIGWPVLDEIGIAFFRLFQKQPFSDEIVFKIVIPKVFQNSPENSSQTRNAAKRKLQHRCFTVNFAKFLSIAFLPNTAGLLMLELPCSNARKKFRIGLFPRISIRSTEHM